MKNSYLYDNIFTVLYLLLIIIIYECLHIFDFDFLID